MQWINWELFRMQAIRSVGLYGHPKAEYAWDMAWKHGYEGGREEILIYLWDIAEIVLEGKENEVR